MCYKPIVFPNNKIIATVTHICCTAHMLIRLPHFTSYCSKSTEFHYVSFSSWQTLSFNFGIRSWNVTLTFFFLLFIYPRGEQFSESGPYNPFRHHIHNQVFQDIIYFWSHHNTKVFEWHGAEMYDSLSVLIKLRFLSCHRNSPQSGEGRKQNIHVLTQETIMYYRCNCSWLLWSKSLEF